MKNKFLLLILTPTLVLISNVIKAQCNYIPSTTLTVDTLSYNFSGGTFSSFGCAPIDPTYWLSGSNDSVIVTFVNPESYPSIRVWGMNDDDTALVKVNGMVYPLAASSASYDNKVVCGISPGPDGVIFSGGKLVGANSNSQGNYSYQNITLNATNIITIAIIGISGAGWGFAGVTVDCPQFSVPVVNLMSSDTSFCEKLCIDFTDLSTNNPTSWQWFFPGADSTTSSLQNPTNICYNNYGSFDVTLITCNAAGCDTLILTSFINEYATPIPTITQSNDTLYASPGVNYQWWSVSSGIITGATNSYFVPLVGGDYFVIVTDTIGCAGTSNVITVTGIAPLSLGEGLGVRCVPNPNNGNFSISLSDLNSTNFSLRIIDPIGRIVFREANENTRSKWHEAISVNLGDVAKGLYVIELFNGNKIYRGRFIVE